MGCDTCTRTQLSFYCVFQRLLQFSAEEDEPGNEAKWRGYAFTPLTLLIAWLCARVRPSVVYIQCKIEMKG